MNDGKFRISKRLSNYNSIDLERAELQLVLSHKLPCFPRIFIEIKNNEIIQYCEVLRKVPININGNRLKQTWLDFEKEIETMHLYNYIHGDILLKNIIFDGLNFRLIDHELQLIDKNKIQVTYPWVDIDDFVNRSISVRTDTICMRATFLRLFDFDKYVQYRLDRINNLNQIINSSNNTRPYQFDAYQFGK